MKYRASVPGTRETKYGTSLEVLKTWASAYLTKHPKAEVMFYETKEVNIGSMLMSEKGVIEDTFDE